MIKNGMDSKSAKREGIMKKALTVLFLVMVMIAAPVAVMAEENSAQTEVTLTLENMDSTTRGYVTKHMAKQAKKGTDSPLFGKIAENVTPENITEWGQAVAIGIKAVCNSLNVEVNEFVTTTVGKLTMAMIVYKVAGEDLIVWVKNAMFTVIGYLLTMSILLFSFIKLHLPRKRYEYTTDEKGKLTRSPNHIWVYPGNVIFDSGDMKTLSAVVHGILFVAFTLLSIVALVG